MYQRLVANSPSSFSSSIGVSRLGFRFGPGSQWSCSKSLRSEKIPRLDENQHRRREPPSQHHRIIPTPRESISRSRHSAVSSKRSINRVPGLSRNIDLLTYLLTRSPRASVRELVERILIYELEILQIYLSVKLGESLDFSRGGRG